MPRISIIGLGLIGTSLGMALRSADEKESPLGKVELVGYDEEPRHVKKARGRLAIDREARSLSEAVRDAQIVVLATPVRAMEGLLTQLASLLPAGAVVTDVASTKAQVYAWAQRALPSGVDYVGGHPMAGKEKAGPTAADATLFQDAIYCLTPARNARPASVEALQALVKTIGAKPYYIDPEEHDAYVAGISHLPLLLSTVLMDVTGSSPAWKEMAPLAATGFRDVSRLASGDPAMQRDICLTNSAALTRWINATITELLEVRDSLAAGDVDKIDALFTRAKQQRDEWLDSRPNLRPGEAEFNDVPQVEKPNLFGFRRAKK
jgi:prephenate dehydrogenase